MADFTTEFLVKLELENAANLNKKLQDAQKKVSDLTIPLIQIAQDFVKSRRAIFQLKGKGQYADLKESTKRAKAPDIYPILRRTGRLEKSITNIDARRGSNAESIGVITNKNTLTLGTRVPYGIFHQEGTSKMARRPFLFFGAESPKNMGDRSDPQISRFFGYIDGYLKQVLKGIE